MARYSNIFGGGMASCSINGRQISIVGNQVYVDGVLYVPADQAGNPGTGGPITPGKMVKHRFDVSSNFTSIISKGFMDVVFNQSVKESDFKVEGHLPENLIEKMEIYVEGGTLVISTKPEMMNINLPSDKVPTIYVTNKVLKDVTNSGSGDFTISGDLMAHKDGFSARKSGSGDFKAGSILGNCRSLNLSSSGSGDIEIAGTDAGIVMVDISGSADVDCGRVTTRICSIDIHGSGDVKISGTTDTVDYSIAGSGNISAGNFIAKKGKASIAGSGDITCNVQQLSDRVRGSGDVHNRY